MPWLECLKWDINSTIPKNCQRRSRNDKHWRKTGYSDKVFIKICEHEGIKDWDCACSFGCDCCNLHYSCPNCGLISSNAPLATLYTQKEKEFEDASY